MTDYLETWQGTMSVHAVHELAAGIPAGIFVGQRPGDFVLGPIPNEPWPTGRCFNEHVELRWWPDEHMTETIVCVVKESAGLFDPPAELHHVRENVSEVEERSYVCVGRYDRRAPAGVHRWWESRYPRCFEYLNTAPPDGADRVILRARIYGLSFGRTQMRLVGFQHAPPSKVEP